MSECSNQDASRVRFDFAPGLVLARKYEVLGRVGGRQDGARFLLSERATGIQRTARFFDPKVDPGNRRASATARKLHDLRHCEILIQYRTQETIALAGRDVTFLVSDTIDGEPLRRFLSRQPGGRLAPFAGLHLLHALISGIERVHTAGERHGDLVIDNVIVRRRGLRFVVKLQDVSPERGIKAGSTAGDIFGSIQVFYEAIGGARAYAQHPPEIKAICCGLRRQLVAARFPTAARLREHLEHLPWS